MNWELNSLNNMKKLEPLLIRLCEILPLNMTLFEEKGMCTKHSAECEYCEEIGFSQYECSKAPYKKPDIFKFT